MKYTVKKGDTLWNIWEKLYSKQMSWEEFLKEFTKLNPGHSPDRIYAGETLNLPDANMLVTIASEHPTLYTMGTFAAGALFMVGVLWLTKKLKI